MAAELDALPRSVHTVLFSSEQMALHLADAAAIQRVRALLAPHFETFEIVVYLRRQDEFAVSRYSSALRAGGTAAAMLSAAGDESALYELADLLGLWASVFGKAAIRPRIFERARLVGGDVIADLLDAIGAAELISVVPEAAQNPALSAPAQELIRRLNILAASRKIKERLRLGLYFRTPEFHGKPRMPSRAEALAFYDRFAASNERVRAEFFPDQATLFSQDFSRYPDRPASEGVALPAGDAVLDVALEVLLRLLTDQRQNELNTLVDQAREAVRSGQQAEASRLWSAVLMVDKRHAEAIDALAALGGAKAVLPPKAGDRSARNGRRDTRRAKRQSRTAATAT